MRWPTRGFVGSCALAALAALAACTGEPSRPASPPPARPDPGAALQAFVPPFFPSGGGYQRRDPRGVAQLDRDGMTLALRGADAAIHWGLVGARAVAPRAEGPLEGRINFFVGHRPRTDLPTYARLVYEGVYPGIDLVLESRPAGVEYSLVAGPGADLRPVRFRWSGAEVTPRADGAGLEVRRAGAAVREEGLLCYQPDGERRRPVGARYAGVRRTADGAEYGVELDRHDAAAPVVIDPQILWGSFAGGSVWDEGRAVAVDSGRNVLLAGYTESSDLPLRTPLDGTFSGPSDAFVMKINPLGSSLIWATFLGGAGADAAQGVAVDPSDNVYVAGYTSSTDFPSTGGFRTTLGGTQDGFITKLSASGSSLLWSSYLGGADVDAVRGLTADSSGNAYLVGSTRSSDFPASGGFDSTLGASLDAFVTKVSPTGSIVWSSYLGGSTFLGDDAAYSVAIDGSRNVYVGGYTQSTDFPTPGGFQTTFAGAEDGFVTKVAAAGTSIVWSTYIGGSSSDYGVYGLAADGSGNVYGILTTDSPDIPISGGFDNALGGLRDAYVFKLNASGSSLGWATYLGGSANDSAAGLALDPSGHVWVTGTTLSTNFPAPGGSSTSLSGPQDAWVAEISADGSTELWGTYLGGWLYEFANAVAVDGNGDVYVTGGTNSVDMPVPGGFDTVYGGNGTYDGFITKIVWDGTPPTAGAVADGLGADVDFQPSSTTLSANWSGFTDPETGIASYQWALGSTPGATDLQAFTSVGLATSQTRAGLSLTLGTPYYVTVRAINGAGSTRSVTSDGVLVDTTAPAPGSVNDGAAADIDFQSSTTSLAANWSGFGDVQSGIAGYEWAIGTTAGGTNVQPFTAVGLTTAASASALTLVDGAQYFVTVRATNGAGLTASVSSDGVRVDASAPAAGVVNDGAGADVDVQSSLTALSANWSGFADAQSGLTGYEWAIGTSAGATNVQAFTAVGLATSASNGALSLSTGTTYFVTVRATNAAGLATTASSDGVLADGTAPTAGTVNDGAGADLRYQTSTTALSANWSGFADAQTGIVRYDWAIGTTAGGTQVQGFTSAGTATSASRAGLALATGTTYFVTVRATNGVGLSTTVSSDGVTVDATPPGAGTVNDGAGADLDVQSSSTALSANWSGFADAQSGIAGYEWAIGTTSGGTEVQGFTAVGGATSASRIGLVLSTGTRYFVTVRATDGVGLTVTATSDGVLVDASAPGPGTVNDGLGADVRYQTSTTTISANWSGFADPETGVTYAWAIGTSAGASDVQGFTATGTATSALNGGLSLTNGTTYYVTVQATNGAGLVTAASSNGVTVDFTPPTAGTVSDGSGADIDFQPSLTTLRASWSGFADPESGILRYEWAIGTSPGATNVQPFTDVGVATGGTNASLPLSTGTVYYVTVRAFSGSGLSTTASSDGVKVDATPPAGGPVNDGTGADVDVQSSASTIRANWTAFVDAESGIASTQWSIGTAIGGSDVLAPTTIGIAGNTASALGLSLLDGRTYFVNVIVTNGAGVTTTASSDGVTVQTTTTDGTPPLAGAVNDGPNADLDAQTDTTALSANWAGFTDPESGISGYEWAIGTSRGGTDVQGFVPVAAGATSASATGLSLALGTTYYVTVRATNGGGLTVTASSDGVTVSSTLPAQPTASPDPIDFGEVTVGSASAEHLVTVQNASGSSWTVTSVVSDNPEFVLDTTGFPSSLLPGQSASFQLAFHPVAAGARSGLLKLFFGGSTTPTTVSLSGTGVAGPGGGGCGGCTSGAGGAPVAAALLVLAAAARRRRRH